MQHETDTPTTSAATDDYDSPWKDMLEHAFPEFIAFYFPDLYDQIDWSQGFEFKNTELRQVVRDAELGKRFADCLVRVSLKSGGERWITPMLKSRASAMAVCLSAYSPTTTASTTASTAPLPAW